MKKFSFIAGAASGALSVALGAFAAHGLQDALSEKSIRIFHTGVEYQFYHSLALMLTGFLAERFISRAVNFAAVCFVVGIILFSGSLYLLAMNESSTWLGLFTPFGGMLFITGWIALVVGITKSR